MTQRSFTLGLLLVLLPCTTAFADPVESLGKLFAETAKSPTQTLTFFRGLAKLERCDVKGDALQRALKKGNLKADGMLSAFVDGMVRIKKDKKYVTIYRDKAATVKTPSGAVRMEKEVRFRVKALGARGAKVEKMKGAKAGKKASSLHPLRWLELSANDDDVTTLKLNAGYGFVSKTVTIVLERTEVASGGIASNLP